MSHTDTSSSRRRCPMPHQHLGINQDSTPEGGPPKSEQGEARGQGKPTQRATEAAQREGDRQDRQQPGPHHATSASDHEQGGSTSGA
eukprot:659944-Heterocapsa_arctica.AAC.1